MGVNLPAHLVVIKGTRRVSGCSVMTHQVCPPCALRGVLEASKGAGSSRGFLVGSAARTASNPDAHAAQYVGGKDAAPGEASGYAEYARHEVLQMVGRAGRPQFDTEVRVPDCQKGAGRRQGEGSGGRGSRRRGGAGPK